MWQNLIDFRKNISKGHLPWRTLYISSTLLLIWKVAKACHSLIDKRSTITNTITFFLKMSRLCTNPQVVQCNVWKTKALRRPAMLVANISAPEFGHCRACYFDDQFFSLVELNYKICAKRSSQGFELPHHPGHMGNLEAPQCLCVRGCSSKCSVAPPDCVQRVCSLVHGRSIQTQGAPR